MSTSVFGQMKFVFVACRIFHIDPPHFPFLFLQLLEKYKLVTCTRTREIGKKKKKRFCSLKRCEAPLRQKCKAPALFDHSVLQV